MVTKFLSLTAAALILSAAPVFAQDCASKCAGMETKPVATSVCTGMAESAAVAGLAGNDEAKAACTEAEKAACTGACSTKTETVAAGMAGNDEHKCTGACGGSTETVAAGMAGNDAMANGKDKAYRVGSKVNDFTATHAQTGASAPLSGVAGDKATVLIFWNQNCPYVVEAVERIDAFAKEYASKGVAVVAIDAGVNNTKDSIMAYSKDRSFPIMINEDSKIAAQFAASRTPEVFILDSDMNIVYHGAFDSGKENTPGSREHYVKAAVDEILAGKPVSVTETRAFGCSLKYAKDTKPLPTS